MELAKKLTALRHAAGFSQQEVAAYISKRLSPITNRAVSKWETGVSCPDAEQFILLCELYGIADVTQEFLGSGMDSPYSGLNREGIAMARDLIALLRSSDRYKAEEREAVPVSAVKVRRTVPLYDMNASAGTGIFLDGDGYVPYESEDVPPTANFAVRIVGDSMAPKFKNGQIAFVQSTTDVDTGDIGIFIYNGDSYCKMLDKSEGLRLVSLNPRYKPISIKYAYELRVVGKVVG